MHCRYRYHTVAAGKLLCPNTKEVGTCAMHVASKIIERITGNVVRTLQKKEVDPFPEAVALFKKISALVNGVNVSSRFKEYRAVNKKSSRTVIVLPMPSETRAAGRTDVQGKAVLRSRYCLELYSQEKEAVYNLLPTPTEWQAYAEIISICLIINGLIFSVQTNRFGHGGELLIHIGRTLAAIRKEIFDVVDFESGQKMAWDASVQYSDLPKRKMTTSEAKHAARAGSKKPLALMSSLAMTARLRAERELAHYFFVSDETHLEHEFILLSFVCNPALIDMGQLELRMLQSEDDADEGKVDALLARAREMLVAELLKVTSGMDLAAFLGVKRMLPPTPVVAQDFLDREVDSEDDDDALSHLHKKPRFDNRKKKNAADAAADLTNEDRVKEEVERLFNLQNDWRQVLREYSLVKTEDIDWNAVSKGDSLYIAKVFDVMKWWAHRGKMMFPIVALIAPRVLSRPASNAYQERIFSTCSWFDSKLRSRLGPERFEMAVLLTVNRVWMEEKLKKKTLDDEAVKESASEVLKFFGVDDLDHSKEVETVDLVGDDDDGNSD